MSLPSVATLVDALRRAAADGRPASADRQGELSALAVELLLSNARQWDLEDVTRRPGADDRLVAGAKRAIDELNLARHGFVERIDAVVDETLAQDPAAPPATEGPGMVIDRLSVLVIRLVRTRTSGAYDERLPILDRQIESLALGLEVLLLDVRSGARRFEPYRHLKLYEAQPQPGVGSRPG